jgi:C4-dicarboxylate transporter DctM subunit
LTWILLTLAFLILVGAPLFVVIGGVTVACFAVFPQVMGGDYLASFDAFSRNFNVLEKMVALADEPTLIAIPFFMVAGAVMSRGAIARRLVALANAMFGWLPGGLAVSAVFACMFFAAISGSSPVTVITIGSIMLPALVARGYKENFGLGLVTSAGSLGIIIPPSIPMIIYAIFASSEGARVNIENLFIAGIGPGILIGGCLAGYCIVTGRGVERDPFEWKKVVQAAKDGAWSLTLPLFILGGIYLGVFNATQASAISVILALVIEIFIHRELDIDELPDLLRETAVLMGSILIIITLAFGFSEFLTLQQLPDKIRDVLVAWDLGPIEFALALNVLLLIVGCLMDIISAIILFVPLIAPIAMELGFDPMHLGLIFIVNLEIGYLTPPLGLNLFVASGYFGKPFGQVVRSVVPFVLMMVATLFIITYVPRISLQLVALKEGGDTLNMDFPSGVQPAAEGGVGEELAPPDPADKSLRDLMREVEAEQEPAPADPDAGAGAGADAEAPPAEPSYDDYDLDLDDL